MFGNPETTTGGKALKFYASLRLDIRRIGPVKERETVIGNHVRVKVVKNKVAPPFRQAEFDIMFDEGISHTSLLVDLAAEANIIQKSGAWYSYGDQRIGQGRENAKLFLTRQPGADGRGRGEGEGAPRHAGRRGASRPWTPRTTTSEPIAAGSSRRSMPDPRRPGSVRVEVDGRPLLRRARARSRRPSGSRSARRSMPSSLERARAAAADAEAAFRTALRALERRPFARADLARRLVRKGHRPAAVEAALERGRSAWACSTTPRSRCNYVQTRAARGRGPAGSRRDLAAMGVERGVDRRALAAAYWPRRRPTRQVPRALARRSARRSSASCPGRRSAAGCWPTWPGAGSPARRDRTVSQLVVTAAATADRDLER